MIYTLLFILFITHNVCYITHPNFLDADMENHPACDVSQKVYRLLQRSACGRRSRGPTRDLALSLWARWAFFNLCKPFNDSSAG